MSSRRHNCHQMPFRAPSMIEAMAAQEAQRPVQVVQQITPFNDTQTVAFIAALSCRPDPKEAVQFAQDVLFEAFARSEELGKRIVEFRKQQAEEKQKAEGGASPGPVLAP